LIPDKHWNDELRASWATLLTTVYLRADKLFAPILDQAQSVARDLQKNLPFAHTDWGESLIYIHRDYEDTLADVFVHLIRNALDHGLEDSDERRSKGKPETGQLSLSLVTDEEGLHIYFLDDGRGLNPGNIIKNAINKKLVEPDLKQPGFAELGEVIFMPGFTTKSAATQISGRGIGMDAVRQFLTQKGGWIRLELQSGVTYDPTELDRSSPVSFHIFLPRISFKEFHSDNPRAEIAS
jgi:signal transduction histidine kinase